MKVKTCFKYTILLFLIFLFEKKSISQYSIPQNILDKKKNLSWIIAKTPKINEEKKNEILNNPIYFIINKIQVI